MLERRWTRRRRHGGGMPPAAASRRRRPAAAKGGDVEGRVWRRRGRRVAAARRASGATAAASRRAGGATVGCLGRRSAARAKVTVAAATAAATVGDARVIRAPAKRSGAGSADARGRYAGARAALAVASAVAASAAAAEVAATVAAARPAVGGAAARGGAPRRLGGGAKEAATAARRNSKLHRSSGSWWSRSRVEQAVAMPAREVAEAAATRAGRSRIAFDTRRSSGRWQACGNGCRCIRCYSSTGRMACSSWARQKIARGCADLLVNCDAARRDAGVRTAALLGEISVAILFVRPVVAAKFAAHDSGRRAILHRPRCLRCLPVPSKPPARRPPA